MPASLETTTLPQPRRVGVWLPVAAVVGLLFCISQLGPVHPLSLLILALVGGFLAVQTARLAPVAFFWLVPLSMSVYWKLWVQPYDLLIIGLAGLMLLDRLSTFRWRGVHLPTVEWRFLLFLGCLATTFLAPYSLSRLLVTAKVYTMGLVAHEVARYAVPRFGRRALLIGPALFICTICASLVLLSREKAIPSFQALGHRNALTDLDWGNSNYVAAVVVVCLPGLMYLLLEAQRSFEKIASRVMIGISVWTLFLTTSRGGFLLGAGYLASRAVRARQALVAVAGFAALLTGIAFTPFGERILGRFTDPQGMFSVAARFSVWGGAWERFSQNMPFGIGHGQGWIRNDRMGAIDPHQFLLTLLSEGGIPALVLWLWLLAALWSDGGRLAREGEKLVGSLLRATVVLGFFNSLFEPTFPGSLYFVLFWWLAGIFRGVEGAPDPSSDARDHAAQHRVARPDSLQHEGA